MKTVVTVILALCLTACGTAGGLVGGMGEDLKKAGDWIKSK
jgi:predicted small secreted protein